MQVENKSNKVEPKEVFAPNSQSEYTLFHGAMNSIVPDGLRGDKRIESSIKIMYDNYYAVVSATHTLAKAVYQFRSLTGLDLDVISNALSKGIQSQLSRSYVSKLCRAGDVLSNNKLAERISDIEKLAELGRYTSKEVSKILTEKNKVTMIDGTPAMLLNRSEFKAKVDAALGTGTIQNAAAWNMRGFVRPLEAAIKGTEKDVELNTVLKTALELINKRIGTTKKDTIKAA